MTKGSAEHDFGAALRGLDLNLVVYKPPDDARNWKPCDFMVWHGDGRAWSTWFEVKDGRWLARFPLRELRPSQVQGIRDAKRIGAPYWLAVHWKSHKSWSISDAVRVLDWFEAAEPDSRETSIPYVLLVSRFGIDARPSELGSVLKAVLLGELG